MTPEYEQYSTLFHTRAEVEGLYQTLSEYAAMNNLVISKIEKKTIKQVTQADAIGKVTKAKKKKTKYSKIYITNKVGSWKMLLREMIG